MLRCLFHLCLLLLSRYSINSWGADFTGWFVLPAPLLLFVFFLVRMPSVEEGSIVTADLPWIPSIGVNFTVYLDGLGLLFALLISGIGSLVVLYSIYYLDKGKQQLNRFYIYLLLFMGAMLGIVLSDNLIVLYGFWELTSISSFLLIAFWHGRDKSMYGALKSMLITVFGGLAMLAGFLLLMLTGTFSIRGIIEQSGELMHHPFYCGADHAAHFPRGSYKIGTVSVSYLAAGCDGSTDSCQCLFALGNDGQSGDLSGSAV